MPEFTTLIAFTLAVLVLVAIPGPNHLYIVTRSLAQGRRAGLASAFGIETGTLVHVAAAAVGVSAIINSSAVAFTVVKYLGAGYLIFLAIRALLDRDQGLDSAGEPVANARLRRVYAEGIVVNVLNPKVALFFLAFLPQFVDAQRGSTALQILILGLVLWVVATASDVIYALVAGGLGAWLRARPAFVRRQRYVTGGVYLSLGVVAALAGGERRTS
jgi:threonine/homoserine/homoserine lactone efflux protein